MNFSNFIIDKLTDTEPKLAIGNKKAGSNAFLFSDIIKICEQENSPLATSELDASKVDSGLEIYASSENVIKVSSEEFESIGQFINSLISQNGEINVSGTHHKVDNALIEKLQFVIPEDKLIELSGDFIDKSSFSLIPLTNTNDLSEFTKPLTISYKNGSNKLSITISPIKVDENSTSRIINNEFSFVNNLIVNEGLMPNAPVIVSEIKTDSEEEADSSENALIEESPEYFDIDKTNGEPAAKIFYKAEIIKIEAPQVFVEPKLQLISLNGDSNQESISAEVTPQGKSIAVDDINIFKFSANSSNYELLKNLQLASEVKPSVNDSELVKTIKTAAERENVVGVPSVENPSTKEIKNVEKNAPLETQLVDKNKPTTKIVLPNSENVSTEQNLEITADKSVQNQKTSSTALNYLMDGLTEEEKSIFKGFASRGEMSEIKYAKQSQTTQQVVSPNKLEKSINTEPTIVDAKEFKIPPVTNQIEKNAVTFTGGTQDSKAKNLTASGVTIAPTENKTVGHQVELKPEQITNAGTDSSAITEQTAESKNSVSIEKPELIKVDPVISRGKELKVGNKNPEVNIEEKPLAKSETVVKEAKLKSAVKQTDNRPTLISKEEFLATKDELKTSKTEQNKMPELEAAKNNATISKEDKVEIETPLKESNLEVTAEGKLLVKVAAKASVKVDINSQEASEIKNKSSRNVNEETNTSEIKINVDADEKRVVESVKPNAKKIDKSEQFVVAVSVENTPAKEKTAETKLEVESKNISTNEAKEIKHSTAEQQLNQNTDKENAKSSSSETFKNNLNQVSGSEKNFSAESLKLQSEPKPVHEQFKTVKQQEIIPEFSKLIQQGEKQTLTLQLSPENLGKVKLTVDMIDNQIVTKIEVENEQVKQFVQSNIEQLKQNMQSAGIPLTNVNVSLSDDQKNQKVFTQKKKSSGREDKEEVIEETISMQAKKHMGYNTYEFTA
ncbi:MAG: flagellar hook-length control protein FliK [Melioribacteraceae bacterium]